MATYAYNLDANGFILGTLINPPLDSEGAEILPTGFQVLPEYTGSFVRPKYDGSNWVEGAVQADIDTDLAAYRAKCHLKIDTEANAKFWELLGGNQYVAMAHLVKGMEANAHWNANDKPAEEVARWPEAVRNKTGNVAEYPIIEGESSARGITPAQMRDAILPLSDAQLNLMRDIESCRPIRKDEIDAAVDRAAVDAVMAVWATNLAGFSI